MVALGLDDRQDPVDEVDRLEEVLALEPLDQPLVLFDLPLVVEPLEPPELRMSAVTPRVTAPTPIIAPPTLSTV